MMSQRSKDNEITEVHKQIEVSIVSELALYKDEDGKPLPHMEVHVLRSICQFAALGLSPQRIANNVGIPTNRVRIILAAKSAQVEIKKLSEQVWEFDKKKAFERMAPEAADKVLKLMRSDTVKDTVQLEACKVILDRAYGKPIQQIEQTTTLIKDVLIKLQEKNREEVEEAKIVPEDKESLPSNSVSKENEDKDPLEDILMK
jgi:hypothetical protein